MPADDCPACRARRSEANALADGYQEALDRLAAVRRLMGHLRLGWGAAEILVAVELREILECPRERIASIPAWRASDRLELLSLVSDDVEAVPQ